MVSSAHLQFHPLYQSSKGWGYSFEGTSPDKLQEIVVPIVQTSYCLEGMNQTEGVDEHLIVCTGRGAMEGGPCQVVTKLLLYDKESDEGYKSVYEQYE